MTENHLSSSITRIFLRFYEVTNFKQRLKCKIVTKLFVIVSSDGRQEDMNE
jgi:hypothetical protein